MACEICASRLLAPFFGSSTVVWANIIGLVLAALSFGYWWGGRLADRHPSPALLAALVLAAAAWVGLLPLLASPLLRLAVAGIDSLAVGTVAGSFAATVALFAPPVALLGTVTPFAVRLVAAGAHDAGRAAGRVFALSTAGSLLGTFLPALVLIPLVGTRRTLAAAALLLVAAALPSLPRRRGALAAAAAALALPLAVLLLPADAVRQRPGLLHERESRYQFIQVVQRGAERRLYLNEGEAVHSVWRADTVLTGGEWDMFLVPAVLLGRRPARVLTVGNAAGTTARAYGAFFPGTRVDGVELDPEVSAVGRLWFGLGDNPSLHVVTADARPFLLRSPARYDLILADAYRQPYVPFHLATREFFRLCRQHLRPGGMLAMNVSAVPGDDRLAAAIAGTVRCEFPHVEVWPALRYNRLVVAFTAAPPSRARLRARLTAAPPALALLTRLYLRDARPVAPAAHPWTDDRAPVEWLTDRMFLALALRGERPGERLLPTAPR